MKKIAILFALLALLLVVGIALQAGNRGEKEQSAEKMVAYMKAELKTGKLTSMEDIEKAIQNGEEQFQISLSEEDKEKVLELMNKIKELGTNPDELSEQAQSLYEEYGEQLLKQIQESAKESVAQSFTDYLDNLGSRVTDFFMNIFS